MIYSCIHPFLIFKATDKRTIISDISYTKDIIMYASLCSSNRQIMVNDILYIKDILTYTSFFQATNGDNWYTIHKGYTHVYTPFSGNRLTNDDESYNYDI